MNDNRQKAPPTRDELIHALKARRNQVVELSQENQAMIEQIQKNNGRLQQQEATIAKLKSDAMKSTVPTIEFPKIQCVRLVDAFRTGLNFGCGLLVAPLVMVFLVFSYMMIIASMAGSSP